MPLDAGGRLAAGDAHAHLEGCAGGSGGRSTVRLLPSSNARACLSAGTISWRAPLLTHTRALPSPRARRPFKADFATGGASKEGRTGRPLTAHFSSDTCNLTGVQPRPATGGPVGKILLKFVSGKYIINCS